MMSRILLIEDDAAHRATLVRHLERAGWGVSAADSAEQALGMLGEAKPEIVLTDVRMPGMSGLELLARLRADAAAPPVIVMTAYGDMQVAIDAMAGGALDYLVKPLDLDRLDEVLTRARAGRRPHGAAADAAPSSVPLVGNDPRMVEVFKLVGTVSRTRTPVLIRGETGTGKELIAREIHRNGPSAAEPFLPVSCTAVPEELFESELFGHVRGAFTGAAGDRRGRFELAGRGTIFLDEVGDTPPRVQSKLLRVLQEHEFDPVGAERPRPNEARVIAATHRPIEELVATGQFREDLYFRLRVVEIWLPPLRERRADIPLLARHFLARLAGELDRELVLADGVLERLTAYAWRGNVRELENALTRAAVTATGGTITMASLALGAPRPSGTDDVLSLDEVEAAHVQEMLRRMNGNKRRTAQALEISRPRLDRLIEKHRLVVR